MSLASESGASFRYAFENIVFDEATMRLMVDGASVAIQVKPLRLLQVLLASVGSTITKDELLDTVWDGVPTVENVLTNAVNKLRAALGPLGAARLVTVPKVGYRFVGPVDRTVTEMVPDSLVDFKPGDRVPGRTNFVLISQLSRTKSSVVWLAEHRKTGAARVYKFALDDQGLAALRREAATWRAISAGLNDTGGFATVIDWNFDAPPFFLESEYAGKTLSDWAVESSRFSEMRYIDRINLCIDICQAMASAHSIGILHKDLKPRNILIGESGQGPKVRICDFGSARFVDAEQIARLELSDLGTSLPTLMIGSGGLTTPLYRAPELLAGMTPTLKSDVYSIGLIIFQLLTGDFNRPLAPGWERDIADPLLRADIAAATDLRTDLRLASAGELLRRLQKLEERRAEAVRENEREAAASKATAALARARARRPWVIGAIGTLTAGLGATITLVAQLQQSEQALRSEVARTAAVLQFVSDDLIAAANPSISGRSDVSVADAARAAATRVDSSLAGQTPALRGTIHLELTRTFLDLSQFADAERSGRAAISAFAEAGNDDAERAGESVLLTVDALTQLNRRDEAAALIEQITHLGAEAAPPSYLKARYWFQKAHLQNATLATGEALASMERAWNALPPPGSNQDRFRDRLQFSLADFYRLEGRLPEAEAIVRDLIARQSRIHGETDVRPSYSTVLLASIIAYQQRYDEALELLVTAVPRVEGALGTDAQRTLAAKNIQAGVYFSLTRYREAAALWRDVAAVHAKRAGDGSIHTLMTRSNIARSLQLAGDLESAEAEFAAVVAAATAAQPEGSPPLMSLRYNLASVRLDLGRTDGVEALLAGQTAETLNRAQQQSDWDGRLAYQRGRLALLMGDRDTAVRELTKAESVIAEKNPGGLIAPAQIRALIEAARGGGSAPR